MCVLTNLPGKKKSDMLGYQHGWAIRPERDIPFMHPTSQPKKVYPLNMIGDTLTNMSEGLKAQVKNGQIILDEPVNLPEGTRLRVVCIETDQIDPELESAIEDGFTDFTNGDFADAHSFARKLTAQS